PSILHLYSSRHPLHLPSFPTRRSSDLFLISTRWVSPLNPGVDCMVTCMASGPTEAREAATVTFTFVGNRRMASTALPVNTTFCSDRKSTRLNSSHVSISYAVFCLKKKK